jgi:hypothetical protein
LRLAAVVAGFAAVTLLTGCDLMPSDPDEAGMSTSQDARPSNLLKFAEGANSTMWVTEQGAERRPVKELYGVFRRSQRSHESAIAHPCSMARAGEDRGKPISGLRRILLRNVGRRRSELVAQPTTSDDVALGLYPEGSASCGATPMTADGLILAVEGQGDSDVAIVYGMFGDGVVSVDLVIDGVRHPARLGENGFAQEIPDAPGKVLDKVVFKHADGSVSEFPPD